MIPGFHTTKKTLPIHSIFLIIKEAMEYKLEYLNTTWIRLIYNTPIYNRLMNYSEPDLQQIYERLARKSRDVLST